MTSNQNIKKILQKGFYEYSFKKQEFELNF